MAPWDELGEGVYRRRYEFLDLNVGLVLGEHGVALIDTRGSLREAQALLRDVKALTDLPVRWVVNTHWHWDHTFGNHMFPEAALYGHVECRRMLREHGERARDHLASRIGPDRREEMEEVVIRAPEIAFANSIEVDLGGRKLLGSHRGRGHTRTDVMVAITDSDVVFAGDLLEESGPPSMSESYPLAWPDTLRAFDPILTGAVVPGHGDVMHRRDVDTQLESLDAIALRAREAYGNGRRLEDVDLTSGPFPESTMKDAMRQAYKELDRESAA